MLKLEPRVDKIRFFFAKLPFFFYLWVTVIKVEFYCLVTHVTLVIFYSLQTWRFKRSTVFRGRVYFRVFSSMSQKHLSFGHDFCQYVPLAWAQWILSPKDSSVFTELDCTPRYIFELGTVSENVYHTPSNKHNVEIMSFWGDKSYPKNAVSLLSR